MAEKNHSVLLGYSSERNLEGMTFDEVWEDFVETNSEGVSCTDVLHFELAPKELAKMLRKGDLRELLDEMRSAGANFVFVGPVTGKPIDGLSI